MAVILGILNDRGHLTSRASVGDVLNVVVPLDGTSAPSIQWRHRVAGVWVDLGVPGGETAPLTVPREVTGHDLMAIGTTPGGGTFTTQVIGILPSGPVLRAPFFDFTIAPGMTLASGFTAGSYTHPLGVPEQAAAFSINGTSVPGTTPRPASGSIAVEEVATFTGGTTYRFPLTPPNTPVGDVGAILLLEDGSALLLEDVSFILLEAA